MSCTCRDNTGCSVCDPSWESDLESFFDFSCEEWPDLSNLLDREPWLQDVIASAYLNGAMQKDDDENEAAFDQYLAIEDYNIDDSD